MIETLKERLEAKYIPEPNSGCWIWMGALNKYGYGEIFVTRKDRAKLAHRISWTIFRGTIPEGMLVCHSCDVPMCINPDHLWLGTHKENTQDMRSKGRGRDEGLPGIMNGRAILTEDQVREIRESSEAVKSLAQKYGLHWATIYKIKNRKLWNHM